MDKRELKGEFITHGGGRQNDAGFKAMHIGLACTLHPAGGIPDVDSIIASLNPQNAQSAGWIAGIGATGYDRSRASLPH